MKHYNEYNDMLQQYLRDIDFLEKELGQDNACKVFCNAVHQLVIEIKKYKEVDHDFKEMA